MADAMSGAHPDSAELQRYADGEVDDGHVTAHVESCGACREEVAAVRRVTALLSLSAVAPDSLLARIESARARSGAPGWSLRHRPSHRARRALFPIGLAAAAALVLLLPRARQDSEPVAPGTKGVASRSVAFETAIREWSKPSVDSVVIEAMKPAAVGVEVIYSSEAGAEAARLAERIAGHLRERGIAAANIGVRRARAQEAATSELNSGAVKVKVLSRVRGDEPR